MKNRLLFQALIISGLAAGLMAGSGNRALATQITFVQSSQGRNQGQSQPGLPPEKKKSLSKYGPEDAFPGATEQENNRRQSGRTPQRSQTPSSTTPSPSPTPSVAPVATPSPAVVPLFQVNPAPTVTAAARGNPIQPLPPPQQASSSQPASEWAIPVLSALALIVSVALIYVVIKLMEKIREGGSG